MKLKGQNSLMSFLFSAFLWLFIVILTLPFLSCSESSSYTQRLNNFYQLLDADTISAFEKGYLEKVVIYLNQKKKEPDFNSKYNFLKKKEAINLFNDLQTVEFFYKYFYLKKPQS